MEKQRDLECAVCLELFKNARNLLCGHTFCLECIDRDGGRGRIDSCPTCRKPTPTIQEMKDLPKNFVAEVRGSSQRKLKFDTIFF